MAPGAILDFDDPDIGVETDLTHQIGFGIGLGGGQNLETRHERALERVRIVEGGLRCRPIDVRGSIEAVHLDEHGARLLGAATPYRREGPFDVTAPKIGRYPDAGFETHGRRLTRKPSARHSNGRPVIAANSRMRRSETCPVIGSLRSRSKRSIAVLVAGSAKPVGATCP